MAPAGPWEFAFLFWRRDLFFARKREIFLVFFCSFFGGVFLRFLVVIAHFFKVDFAFWGVFSRYAAIISRAARFFWGAFPPRGAVSKTRNFRFGTCFGDVIWVLVSE